jgi:hypothetical protein
VASLLVLSSTLAYGADASSLPLAYGADEPFTTSYPVTLVVTDSAPVVPPAADGSSLFLLLLLIGVLLLAAAFASYRIHRKRAAARMAACTPCFRHVYHDSGADLPSQGSARRPSARPAPKGTRRFLLLPALALLAGGLALSSALPLYADDSPASANASNALTLTADRASGEGFASTVFEHGTPLTESRYISLKAATGGDLPQGVELSLQSGALSADDDTTVVDIQTASDVVSSGVYPLTLGVTADATAPQGTYELNIEITTVDKRLGLSVTGIEVDPKEYDGTSDVSYTGSAILSGVVTGDTVELGPDVSFALDDRAVGERRLVATGTLSGIDAFKYLLRPEVVNRETGEPLVETVAPRSLAISGVTAEGKGKVYDGSTTVGFDAGSATLQGVLEGETVTVDSSKAAAAFEDKNAGTGKAVSFSGFGLAGADAANYTLRSQPAGVTADIAPKELTIGTGSFSIDDKAYDGRTSATHTGALALDGVVGNDDVALDASDLIFAFLDKDVGNGKPITATGTPTLVGADAGNYTLAPTLPTLTADIGRTAPSKTPAKGPTDDPAKGPTDDPAKGPTDDPVKGPTDDPVKGPTEDPSKNPSDDPPEPPPVVKKTLTIVRGDFAIGDKVYDGATTATHTGALTLTGVAGNDDVALDASDLTFAFLDKDVGNGKPITATGTPTLVGADADAYTLATALPALTAGIAPKGLAVGKGTFEIKDKVYDGTTTAASEGALALVGVVGADDVTLVASGATFDFDSRDVGAGKAVVPGGATPAIAGADAGNYALDPALPALTAGIAPKGLAVGKGTFEIQDKVYDGGTQAAS